MPGKKATKKTTKPRSTTATKNANKKKSQPSKTKPASQPDFAPVFSALKAVMATHESELRVVHDEPKKYYLVTKSLSWKDGPMFFGAVMLGKAYVSYHLMPLYISP
jgi:hypothetical protein